MSESNDSSPSGEDLRAVQAWLAHLSALTETEPQRVIDESQSQLGVLAMWTRSDAYAWAMVLRAKAYRTLDDVESVLGTAETALGGLRGDERVCAHLHLEAGMSLNQFGRTTEAVAHLGLAARLFAAHHDDDGRAWALTFLAEAYAGTGQKVDPVPLLEEAIIAARSADQPNITRRAYKQLAIAHRHQGHVELAMDAIDEALLGETREHPRANSELERGHILSWLGDYAGSDECYESAAAVYAAFGDHLGQANCARALAVNALILQRVEQGLNRLEEARDHYRAAGQGVGEAYVLRERSLVLLDQGNVTDALSEAELGLAAFRRTSDLLGLAGMLRAAARIARNAGKSNAVETYLSEGERITADGSNPLARAGILLAKAESASDPDQQAGLSSEAASLFRGMQLHAGEAHSEAMAATAACRKQDEASCLAAFSRASAALRQARIQVVDPLRRSDHDHSLREVARLLLDAAMSMESEQAFLASANLLVDEAPLGMRGRASTTGPAPRVRRLLDRVKDLPSRLDRSPSSQRHLLQQLAAAATTLGDEVPWTSFNELADAHAEDAVIVLGSPTSNGDIPMAWRLPGGGVRAALKPVSRESALALEHLRAVLANDGAEPLWDIRRRSWQTDLTELFLPAEMRAWLKESVEPHIGYLLPPALSQVPIEALLLDDGRHLGTTAAVYRITFPSPCGTKPSWSETVAFLDPALAWPRERAALQDATTADDPATDLLGADRLILVACHGEAAPGLQGALVTASGKRVIDAIDVMSSPLMGSVVVLEACFAGRHIGPEIGEQLSLATIAVSAGASACIAGLFALPAQDDCTGAIVAHLLEGLRSGLVPPEALRRARLAYLDDSPRRRDVPGVPRTSMEHGAPWAWAGLVCHSL